MVDLLGELFVCFYFFTKKKINLFCDFFWLFFFSFLEQCAHAEVGRREGSSMSFTAWIYTMVPVKPLDGARFFRGHTSDHNRPNLFKKVKLEICYVFVPLRGQFFPKILWIWINFENRSNGLLKLHYEIEIISTKSSWVIFISCFQWLFQ